MAWVKYYKLQNNAWDIWQRDADKKYTNEQVVQCILLDIRSELIRLNALLHCTNFQNVPLKLDRIARNTTKRKTNGRKKPV
jgi:hypothetical protein